jgi:hypothetical protein
MTKLALVTAIVLSSISMVSAASITGVDFTDVAPDGIQRFTTTFEQKARPLHRSAPLRWSAEQNAFDRATDVGEF